jgi:hypothetical protein
MALATSAAANEAHSRREKFADAAADACACAAAEGRGRTVLNESGFGISRQPRSRGRRASDLRVGQERKRPARRPETSAFDEVLALLPTQ